MPPASVVGQVLEHRRPRSQVAPAIHQVHLRRLHASTPYVVDLNRFRQIILTMVPRPIFFYYGVNLIPLFGIELFEGIDRRYLRAVFIESAIRALGGKQSI